VPFWTLHTWPHKKRHVDHPRHGHLSSHVVAHVNSHVVSQVSCHVACHVSCQHGRHRLAAWQMANSDKKDLYQWPKLIVIERKHFYDDDRFVIERMNIYDKNCRFVTICIMWRTFHDKHHFATNSSQNKLCDDFRVFSDERIASLVNTSLVVIAIKHGHSS
jgi:hypothetical protein